MAGRVIQLLKRSYFDMSGLAAGAAATVVVATRVHIADYSEATLLARLHGGGAMATDATVAPVLFADGFTDEDPSPAVSTPPNPPFFVSNDPVAATQFDGTMTAPVFLVAGVPSGFGGLLLAAVRFVQGSIPGTFTATLSLDLSVKCPPRGAARWPRAPRDTAMLSNAERAAFVRASRGPPRT